MRDKDRTTLFNVIDMLASLGNSTDFERGVNYACNMITEFLAIMPTESDELKSLKEDEWFRVSEHTPPYMKSVLGYAPEYESIYCVSYQGDGTFNYSSCITTKCEEEITHWRPLPESPTQVVFPPKEAKRHD